jgi:hypothetical protein
MSKRAQWFVGSTIAAGVCLLAYTLGAEVTTAHSAVYFSYLFLALLASTLKIHLPGISGTISVNFLLILMAVATCSFAETVFLAAAACLVQCLWRSRTRPKLVQVAFNVSALAISSALSYRATHLFTGGPGIRFAALLALAACLYFTADTLLVSGALSLVQSKSLFTVWQQCYVWSFPYYLIGAAIAGMAVAADRTVGPGMSMPLLAVMYLVYVFYRIVVDRISTDGNMAV